MPPELTEKEKLAVAILISKEEKRRRGAEGIPGARGRPGSLGGAATTSWATADAAAVHSVG
jgi:hypothetical protein